MSDMIEDIKLPVPAASAGVINNITVVLPAPPVAARTATSGGTPQARKPNATKLPPPIQDVDPGRFGSLFGGGVTTDYYYDAKDSTVKHTRLIAPNGASAVLREDPSDHNKVTLTLIDKKGSLVTRGDARGFAAVIGSQKQVADPWPLVRDTLTCGSSKTDIVTNETESVTRDKLKQFAEDNPALAVALRNIRLPVTVVGGIPKTFAEAIDTPSQYRACPEDRSGILLERLTEKSAPRK